MHQMIEEQLSAVTWFQYQESLLDKVNVEVTGTIVCREVPPVHLPISSVDCSSNQSGIKWPPQFPVCVITKNRTYKFWPTLVGIVAYPKFNLTSLDNMKLQNIPFWIFLWPLISFSQRGAQIRVLRKNWSGLSYYPRGQGKGRGLWKRPHGEIRCREPAYHHLLPLPRCRPSSILFSNRCFFRGYFFLIKLVPIPHCVTT